MLSMVLLVLLLCFEPAKAGLLEPAKAAMFSLLLQPAKARPPLPWWRVRVWENRYFLCNPDGWIRELEDEEADELDDVFDDNTAASKYVWAESAQHLAGNCWRVSWEEPRYWWYQYQTPNNAGTPDYYQHWEDWNSWQPVQGYGANIAKAAISLHKATDPQGPTPGHLQGGQPMSLQRLPLKKMSCNICIGAKGPE